jgi:UDP-glucose 4-epimerase
MKLNKIQILILGADGFIGSNLVKSLQKEKKYKIFAFDHFRGGVSRNIQSFDKDLVMVPGDFLNKEDIKKALVGIDYVFHFISLTTPGSSMNEPLIDVNTNIVGTINLLEECVIAEVKRVIFSSSGGAIYGNENKDIYAEEDATNPISPYAISKLTIEKYLEYFKINKGLDYLILRYANPYGPGQNVVGSQGIIPIFLNLIRQDKPITIFGDGKNIRDYIYIDDLINITKLLFSKKTKYKIYNVGSGKGESINEIISIMSKVVKKNIKIENKPARLIDVRKIVLDSIRSVAETAYTMTMRTSLEDGIRKTWNWIQTNL